MPGFEKRIGGRLLGTTTQATRIFSGSAAAGVAVAARKAAMAIRRKRMPNLLPSRAGRVAAVFAIGPVRGRFAVSSAIASSGIDRLAKREPGRIGMEGRNEVRAFLSADLFSRCRR